MTPEHWLSKHVLWRGDDYFVYRVYDGRAWIDHPLRHSRVVDARELEEIEEDSK